MLVHVVTCSSPNKDNTSYFLSVYKSKLYNVVGEQLLLAEDMLVKIMVSNTSQRLITFNRTAVSMVCAY